MRVRIRRIGFMHRVVKEPSGNHDALVQYLLVERCSGREIDTHIALVTNLANANDKSKHVDKVAGCAGLFQRHSQPQLSQTIIRLMKRILKWIVRVVLVLLVLAFLFVFVAYC
jgi:hypothetical protein